MPLLTGIDYDGLKHIGDAFWAQRVSGQTLSHRGDVLHPRSSALAGFLYNRRELYVVVLGSNGF